MTIRREIPENDRGTNTLAGDDRSSWRVYAGWQTSRALTAINNLKIIRAGQPGNNDRNDRIEMIDLLKNRQRPRESHILDGPTLHRTLPLPFGSIIVSRRDTKPVADRQPLFARNREGPVSAAVFLQGFALTVAAGSVLRPFGDL